MSSKSSGFQPRAPEDYFWLISTAGLCLFVLGGAVIMSVFIHVEVGTMRSDLHEDMGEFISLTEKAWADIMHLRPAEDSVEAAFLVGIRVKKHTGYVRPGGYVTAPPRHVYVTTSAPAPGYGGGSTNGGYDQGTSGGTSTANDSDKKCVCGKISSNCPKGPPGPQGDRGERGLDGSPGIHGNPGEDGEQYDFEEVIPPCIACPIGPPGVPGDRGKPGPSGLNGRDGHDGINGRDGDDGAIGCEGDVGLRGPQGPQGPRGEPGADGTYGTGPRGPKGDRGAFGHRGPPGQPGRGGDPGPIGPEGPAGPEGPRGEQGFDGIPGIPGSSGKDAIEEPYCPCPKRFTQNKNSPPHINPRVVINIPPPAPKAVSLEQEYKEPITKFTTQQPTVTTYFAPPLDPNADYSSEESAPPLPSPPKKSSHRHILDSSVKSVVVGPQSNEYSEGPLKRPAFAQIEIQPSSKYFEDRRKKVLVSA